MQKADLSEYVIRAFKTKRLLAGQRIRLQCGASVIELSPGQITLNAPLIKINS